MATQSNESLKTLGRGLGSRAIPCPFDDIASPDISQDWVGAVKSAMR